MRAKKLIAFLFFVFVFAQFSFSDSSSVWRVSKHGKTFFLGGSIHILREKDFPLPDEYDRAFSQAAVLVFEADIEMASSPEIQQYLFARMYLPDGATLRSILAPEIYDALIAVCAEFGMVEENIERLNPSVLINIITAMEYQRMGYVEEGVDAFFYTKARGAGKPVLFLETVESQIDLLTNMYEGSENELIEYSLHSVEDPEAELDSLVAGWKAGNWNYIETEVADMRQSWPQIYARLMVDRNNSWMPQLEAFLETEDIEFVITGLAHLHGPEGLLKQLARAGCTVEPFR